ncbi:hypothetical protein FACS1894145_7150 [Bacteroidia bacterium]|nr:hypothetical protein FACS1894145_7150 [Bacteroidia bacterium]
MKNRKRIQLDIVNIPNKDDFKKLNIYVDGYCYDAYLPIGNYILMLQDGVFIRDGKIVDSANVLNTTETFYSDSRQEIIL